MHRPWIEKFFESIHVGWMRHDLSNINGCDMEVVQGQWTSFGKLGNAHFLQLSPNRKFSFCTGTQYCNRCSDHWYHTSSAETVMQLHFVSRPVVSVLSCGHSLGLPQGSKHYAKSNMKSQVYLPRTVLLHQLRCSIQLALVTSSLQTFMSFHKVQRLVFDYHLNYWWVLFSLALLAIY